MILRILTGLLAILALTACVEDTAPVASTLDIDAGRQIAQADCSGCHGEDGGGRTAEVPNLAGQPADYLVDAMYAYRDGRRHHAALQDLISSFSEADIQNIAGYFASLPPLLQDVAVNDVGSAYQDGAEFAAVCVDCHGARGVSTTPGIPSLAGQQTAYLIVSTQEYADGSRGHEGKEEMLRGLGEVDIEKMAMYFSSQIPAPRDPPPFGDAHAGEPLTAVCGSCHGARGVSREPLVPSLASQEPTYLVNAIKAYRNQERVHEGMVSDKTDEEIDSIAAYYSVQSLDVTSVSDQPLEDLIAKCNRCHDRAQDGSAMAVPALRGQKQEYLLRVMKEYRDGERGNSMMHKMSAGYSDQLLQQIAAHYASQRNQ